MKTKYIFTLAAALLFATLSTFAQEQPAEKVKPLHRIGLWGDVGYSNLLYKSDYTKPVGGVGGGLALFYELKYKHFLFDVGAGFDIYSSKLKINDFNADIAAQANGVNSLHISGAGANQAATIEGSRRYSFSNYSEKQLMGMVTVPILAGGQWDRWFFLAGTKIGIPVMGNTKASLDYKSQWSDPGIITDLPFDQQSYSGDKQDLKFKLPNIMLSAEFGISLDEWLVKQPDPKQKGRKPKRRTFADGLRYRLSVFADYGLLDFNKKADNQYAVAAGGAGDGLLAVNNAGIAGINPAFGDSKIDSKLNSLLVGVKFAILYEFAPKVVKPKPQPKPKPAPKPKPKPAPKPKLLGNVTDVETNAALTAQVVILSQDGTKTLFTGDASEAGEFKTTLLPGTYKVQANRPGYMPFEQEMTFEKEEEPLRIQMQRIVEGRKFVIKNLFFATAKTEILPESEPSLQELFEFLDANPDLRVKIVGHTDNVGNDRANKILSEGRALSVMQSMIDRGIASDRLEYEGRGESDPIDTNDTDEGRQNNRRVEFVIIGTADNVTDDQLKKN